MTGVGGLHQVAQHVDDLDRALAFYRDDEPHRIHRDEDGQFGPRGNEEWMAFFRDSEQNLVGLVEQRLDTASTS